MTELYAKCLDLDVHLLDVENLVSDEGLEEDADEAHESVLHITVFDRVTSRNAVGDVQMNEFSRQFHGRC